MFICIRAIQMSKIYSIYNKKIKLIIVEHEYHKYSSHNSSIKCIITIIKRIEVGSIYYVINMNIV